MKNNGIIYCKVLWVLWLFFCCGVCHSFAKGVNAMIKRKEDMTPQIKVNMRGGDGQAVVTPVLEKDEYNGKSRLVATIVLEPGCSIGPHIHENEEEIFYIIDGVATYYDNGETVTLNPGDSCVCLGGQTHSIANRTDATLRVFAVILTY